MHFDPAIGDTQGEADLASFDGKLFYAYRGSRGDEVWMGGCTDGGYPDAQGSWSVAQIDSTSVGTEVVTTMRPQLVVAGGQLLLFWDDSSWDQAVVTALDVAPNSWQQYSLLGDAAGAPIDTASRVMSVIAAGTRIIVSTVGDDSIRYYVYRPEDRVAGSMWKAVGARTVGKSTIESLLGSTFDELSHESSMALFSIGGSTGVNQPSSVTGNILVQTLVDDDSEKSITLQARLDDSALPLVDSANANVAWWPSDSEGSIVLKTDPGGRVIATGTDDDDKAWVRMMSTATLPGTWGDSTYEISFSVDAPPVVAYAPRGSLRPEKVGDKDALVQDVVQVIMVPNDDGDITGDLRSYGKLRKVLGAETLDVTSTEPEESRKYVIEGYIDGPLPVPQSNIDLAPDELMAKVTYGDTESTSSSDLVTEEYTVGVKSTGNLAPEVGTGLAWDIALSVSAGSSFGSTTKISLTESIPLEAVLDSDQKVLPLGLATTKSIILTRDEYQFVAEGESEPVSDATTFSLVYLDLQNDTKTNYTVTTVTPGDLDTYLAESWDARMQSLYPGKSYIRDIVEPRAVSFRYGGQSVRKLSVSWATGSMGDVEMFSSNETYSSTSLRLDESIFAGVSAKFLGAEATMMAGFEVKVDTTTTSTELSSFGVKAGLDLAGPTTGEKGVTSYSFDIYFLPASSDWVNELKHFLPTTDPLLAMIPDGGTSCWKIMYVVTHVVNNDLVSDLIAYGLPETRARELEAQGVLTTDQLLASLGVREPAQLRRLSRRARAEHEALFSVLRRWDTARNRYGDEYEYGPPRKADRPVG